MIYYGQLEHFKRCRELGMSRGDRLLWGCVVIRRPTKRQIENIKAKMARRLSKVIMEVK